MLENFRGIRLRMQAKRSFAKNVRAMLDELDPNLVLMDARDLTPDAGKSVLELLSESIVVVVCGENDRVAALEKAAKAQDIPVHRPGI